MAARHVGGEARWRAPVSVRELVGLPDASPLWRWQPDLRSHLIEARAFAAADLATRDGLPALWFRLERAGDPAQVVAIADALIACLALHPGFSEARKVFAEFLGAVMARSGMDPQAAEDFLDMSGGLLARAEQWQQEWLREGRQQGEAEMLLRLLERRFGALPDGAMERVRAAETSLLEDWGMRLFDAASLDDVPAERPG